MKVTLVMFREDGRRVDIPVTKEVTSIGRKEECDIRIPLPEVSRKHVEIFLSDAVLRVKDRSSANGTYVNNKKVSEEKLAAGDHLIVGPVVFTVQIDGDPSDIRPVKTKLKRRPAGTGKAVSPAGSASGSALALEQDELDPISALEALASSADQTAIDPLEDDEI